jgi:hypothetical protein
LVLVQLIFSEELTRGYSPIPQKEGGVIDRRWGLLLINIFLKNEWYCGVTTDGEQ